MRPSLVSVLCKAGGSCLVTPHTHTLCLSSHTTVAFMTSVIDPQDFREGRLKTTDVYQGYHLMGEEGGIREGREFA